MLGAFIRNTRFKLGYSVEQFARISLLPVDSIVQMEQGRLLPSKWQLLRLAAWLEISEEELLVAHHEQLIVKGKSPGGSVSVRTELLMKDVQLWREQSFFVKAFEVNSFLSGYVESIVYYEKAAGLYAFEKLMPDGMPQLVIDLETLSSVVIGQHDIPLCLPLNKNIRKMVVRFHPQGLYLLTGIPQHELLNRVLDAEYIFGRTIYELEAALHHCRCKADLGTILHRYLMSRVQQETSALPESRVVNFIIDHIDNPIAFLVKKTGYSPRYLIHLFRTYTGVTPKAYQQIRQFAASINEISLLPTHHLTAFNWSKAYFDQAHFIRQFKRFSGFTPTAYLNTGNTCPRMVML